MGMRLLFAAIFSAMLVAACGGGGGGGSPATAGGASPSPGPSPTPPVNQVAAIYGTVINKATGLPLEDACARFR